MRIDRLLWFLRWAKTRTIAQSMAEAGHIRLNGRRVERAHQQVAAGDVLVVPVGATVRVLELVVLPTRRGPASEARGCYRLLDEQSHYPIAAGYREPAAEEDLQP
ncbi:MAG: S4 domain-containing protein [Novosphingobium sp.]